MDNLKKIWVVQSQYLIHGRPFSILSVVHCKLKRSANYVVQIMYTVLQVVGLKGCPATMGERRNILNGRGLEGQDCKC